MAGRRPLTLKWRRGAVGIGYGEPLIEIDRSMFATLMCSWEAKHGRALELGGPGQPSLRVRCFANATR